jgi:hypothetical protein
MTTKATDKPRTDPQGSAAPTHEEVHAIYQCHTLAQILYRHLWAAAPWCRVPPFPGALRAGMPPPAGASRPNPGLAATTRRA